MAVSMDNVNIDSEAEDTVDDDLDSDGSGPMSIFKLYQLGETESTHQVIWEIQI